MISGACQPPTTTPSINITKVKGTVRRQALHNRGKLDEWATLSFASRICRFTNRVDGWLASSCFNKLHSSASLPSSRQLHKNGGDQPGSMEQRQVLCVSGVHKHCIILMDSQRRLEPSAKQTRRYRAWPNSSLQSIPNNNGRHASSALTRLPCPYLLSTLR